MALTPEDKKDVKTHLGKALANKVSSVTKDGGHPSKEFKTSISDVRNNFSKEYKEKGLAMRAERVAKEAKSKALQGKSGDEALNAWGQDAKTAKGIRKHLRQEKAMKAFQKGAGARHAAGY